MRPAIIHTTLFSLLVTRPTGRSVRTNVERQIAAAGRTVLAVLDMRDVPLIDFSCADEIVAKLVLLASDASPQRWFVLFRGIGERHLGPIETALSRQGLAAAAESAEGQPLLLGALDPGAVAVWREIWTLGRTRASPLATRLQLPVDRVEGMLEELVTRALVIRDGNRYVSLGRAFQDADPPPAEDRGER
ncbi:hypothetical protein [Candidatus Palauibacter sp.]|uniref:hypothetical protein n=1 Tax=Candidatus Palauibacter sp. TaxID=3101350 RepID=UPI003B5B774A